MTDEFRDKIIEIALEKQKSGELKTGADLENYIDNLLQPLMQALLEGEQDNHLEYKKYEHTDKGNSRNGYCKEKTVQTKYGSMKIKTPRDRDGSFEPIVIEKGQTKMPGFEDKCISLYAKGMSLRDIEKTLKEFYGVNINKDEISHLINKVNEEVDKWRRRPLKSLYVFAYADCLYIPIKEDIRSDKKAVYVMIGVDAFGFKDILGIWMDKSESATFWTEVFEDIKSRGVEDILYISSDGIAGFKGSLETFYPKTQSQRCVVHLTRNLHQICPKNEASKIIAGFKKIYRATSLEVAQIELEEFLKALNEDKLIDEIKKHYEICEPLMELIHEKALDLYKKYLVIGGMPTVIKNFIENGCNIAHINYELQDYIITSYLADMNKYTDNKSDGIKNAEIYNAIPRELVRINNVFMYSLIDKDARRNRYERSLEWLLASNMILKCDSISKPESPLKAYQDKNTFKLYLSDTGLLRSLSNIEYNEILLDKNEMYKGVLTENYVACELYPKTRELYYYTFGTYEIDFLIKIDGDIIPIEVKSGRRTSSKSLNEYIKKYNPKYSIRISQKNFGFTDNIKSVPLYAVFCIK